LSAFWEESKGAASAKWDAAGRIPKFKVSRPATTCCRKMVSISAFDRKERSIGAGADRTAAPRRRGIMRQKVANRAGVLWCALALLAVFGLLGGEGASALAQQGVLHSATGSGHLAFVAGEPYWDSYSFTAKILADGRVLGQVQYFDKMMRFSVHGEVFDLKVDGTMAKIAFRIKHGTYPWEGFEDDRYGFFVVVDNGEGGDVTNCDMISWLVPADEEGFFGTSLQELIDMEPDDFIAWLAGFGYEPALFAYVKGNIQVR
jgi:hypothetical protein